MDFEIVFDREEDGRWIAEIERLPGFWLMGPPRQKLNPRWKRLRCV